MSKDRDKRIEAATSSTWLCLPFGEEEGKHWSKLPAELAADVRRLEAERELLIGLLEDEAISREDTELYLADAVDSDPS